MALYHENCYEVMKGATIFPLEMDLSRDAFAYKSDVFNTGDDVDDEEADVEPLEDVGVDAAAAAASADEVADKMETLLDLGSPPKHAEDPQAAAPA